MPLFQTQERYTLKSSTRNHPNSATVADRRFEALVKKEMIEHQHIISSHNKEMQSLRDSLSLAMEKFKSISERNDKELQEFKAHSTNEINALKDRMKADEAIIIDQRKTIEGLNQQIIAMYMVYATKADIDKLTLALDGKFKQVTTSNINSFQDCQRELTNLVQSLKNDLTKLGLEIEQKLAQLAETGESNFSVSKIDRDGVLKELNVCKKDMFYVQKKIENIYTLIERINKRGELCHKPG